MNRFIWLGMLVMWGLFTLTGCSVLAWFFGTAPGDSGQPGDSPVAAVIGFLQTIPGIGTAAAAALGVARWGWVEKRHYELVKEGKKDDNNNGIDDALERKPPVNPT